MGSEMQQIDSVKWRGLDIPVRADFNAAGQPVGVPLVMIEDMPEDFRVDFEAWLRDVRIIGIGRASSNSVYLDDIEQFLSWEQAQARLAAEED